MGTGFVSRNSRMYHLFISVMLMFEVVGLFKMTYNIKVLPFSLSIFLKFQINDKLDYVMTVSLLSLCQ